MVTSVWGFYGGCSSCTTTVVIPLHYLPVTLIAAAWSLLHVSTARCLGSFGGSNAQSILENQLGLVFTVIFISLFKYKACLVPCVMKARCKRRVRSCRITIAEKNLITCSCSNKIGIKEALQFLVLFCCILLQWVFYHGCAVGPHVCCPAKSQRVGFGENFQLEAVHLGDNVECKLNR